MKKLLEATDAICHIYEVDFRNLVAYHEVSSGQDINGEVHIVLVDVL